MKKLFQQIIGLAALGIIATALSFTHHSYAETIPMKAESVDSASSQSIVLSGGCFWGVQAVFQHVKGVTKATSGYAGGDADTAHYDMVSTGTTGHAESVQVTYDPRQVSLDQLLDIYFKAAHDPTELNYQGPDHGTQYRSAIFYTSQAQKDAAETKVKALEKAGIFSSPIVTKLEPLKAFYPAEDYHQNYATLHPYNPYILMNDRPKLTVLQEKFPNSYAE